MKRKRESIVLFSNHGSESRKKRQCKQLGFIRHEKRWGSNTTCSNQKPFYFPQRGEPPTTSMNTQFVSSRQIHLNDNTEQVRYGKSYWKNTTLKYWITDNHKKKNSNLNKISESNSHKNFTAICNTWNYLHGLLPGKLR